MRQANQTAAAYEQIRARITKSEYEGYINVNKISKEIGIGYTPVREALLRLQSEGLVSKEENVGYFVNKVDMEDLIYIFQVRECVEMYVWDHAFARVTDADVERLKELHAREEAMFRAGTVNAEFSRLDIQIHSVMLERYGNPLFSDLYRNIRQRNLLCPTNTANLNNAAALDEHAELIGYVEARNKQKAIAMLQTHITNTKARMQKGFITFLD